MTFDPETLARLAGFAREIEAPEGETFDDLLEAKAAARKAEIEALQERIAELSEASRLAWESAAQQARDFEAQLHGERRAILDNPQFTERQRSAAYREHLRTYGSDAGRRVFDQHLGGYYAIKREQHQLTRELERMQDES
ncbi:MAG TPA: hypothetical protein VJ841_00720 [Candidatus Saccharimonadales bacterium]|nr:hypothetical protein [Candidatus Saccharimonadales bacterium]